jgi:hypothetical protein
MNVWALLEFIAGVVYFMPLGAVLLGLMWLSGL